MREYEYAPIKTKGIESHCPMVRKDLSGDRVWFSLKNSTMKRPDSGK